MIMFSALVVLVTAFYVEEIIASNSVSSIIEKEISLTGSRLSDSLYAGITSSESWQSNREIATEYNFRINNTSVSPISNWKIIFDVPGGSSISSYWGCEAKIDTESNKLYVSPTYYNLTLVADGYVEFGFIINSTDNVKFSSIKLEGYKQFYNNKMELYKNSESQMDTYLAGNKSQNKSVIQFLKTIHLKLQAINLAVSPDFSSITTIP